MGAGAVKFRRSSVLLRTERCRCFDPAPPPASLRPSPLLRPGTHSILHLVAVMGVIFRVDDISARITPLLTGYLTSLRSGRLTSR